MNRKVKYVIMLGVPRELTRFDPHIIIQLFPWLWSLLIDISWNDCYSRCTVMYESAHMLTSRSYFNCNWLGMLFQKVMAYVKDQSTEKLHSWPHHFKMRRLQEKVWDLHFIFKNVTRVSEYMVSILNFLILLRVI